MCWQHRTSKCNSHVCCVGLQLCDEHPASDCSSRRGGKTVGLPWIHLFFSTAVASHARGEACVHRPLQIQEPEECETPADAASGPVEDEEGGGIWQTSEASGGKAGEQRFSSLVISLRRYTKVYFSCSLQPHQSGTTARFLDLPPMPTCLAAPSQLTFHRPGAGFHQNSTSRLSCLNIILNAAAILRLGNLLMA